MLSDTYMIYHAVLTLTGHTIIFILLHKHTDTKIHNGLDSVSALKEICSVELVLDCFAPPLLSLNWFNSALDALATPNSTRVCFCRPVGKLGSCIVTPESRTRFWHEVVDKILTLIAKSPVLPQPVKLLAFRFNFVTDDRVVQRVGEVPERLFTDRIVCAGCHRWIFGNYWQIFRAILETFWAIMGLFGLVNWWTDLIYCIEGTRQLWACSWLFCISSQFRPLCPPSSDSDNHRLHSSLPLRPSRPVEELQSHTKLPRKNVTWSCSRNRDSLRKEPSSFLTSQTSTRLRATSCHHGIQLCYRWPSCPASWGSPGRSFCRPQSFRWGPPLNCL